MKILIIGKNGQLGKSINKIKRQLKKNYSLFFVGRGDLDLTYKKNIKSYFKKKKFDTIINCAAYTEVEKAETEPNLANQINNIAVEELAKVAKLHNAKLIHLSTDYVFDGKKNKSYQETDKPNPINIYGKSKYKGEVILKKIMPYNAIIIRSSWIYSEFGKNFMKTIIKLGNKTEKLSIVDDQIGCPTYATDLAKAILNIIKSKNFNQKKFQSQIYHYSCKDKVSWYKFAKQIFKLKNVKCKVKPISTKKYKTLAKRPKNSSLNCKKILNSFNLNLYSWKSSLQRCIKENYLNDIGR